MALNTEGYLIPEAHGELGGETSATQMPDIPCKRVIFEALGANGGKIYIGLSSNVSIPDGSTNTTCGIEVPASTPLELFVENMNDLWYICANAADDLTYFCYR